MLVLPERGRTRQGVMDVETKGVTCKIPLDLHEKISAEIRETESTLSRFIEKIIREHYEKGEIKGMAKERTLAFQVSEELFGRIKAYLERYAQEHSHRLTQREFVIGLIEQALDAAEESDETEETGLTACVPACDEEAAGGGSVPTESQESAPGDYEAGYESAAPEQEIYE